MVVERYEAYKDSGVEWIGEIPENWKNIATKRLVSIANGSEPMTEGDIPVYGSSGIAFKTCGESKDPPAVLLGRKGTIDSPSYIEIPYWNIDTAFDAKPLSSGLLLKYYFYLANCFDYGKYQTATALPSMTQTNYGDMRIPVPCTDEQQTIVDFLDAKTAEIDGLVADCEREVELLREYRKAVISEAVTKGLDPDAPMKDSGIEWIGEIPDGWSLPKLGGLTVKIGSGKTPRGGADVYAEEGVPFLRSQNIYDTGLVFDNVVYLTEEIDEEMASTRVVHSDVLLNITGGSIGRCCVYELDTHANVNQHVCIIRIGSLALPKFIQFYWNSSLGATTIDMYQTGANREGMNFEQIASARIPLPPIHEQESIVDYLEAKTAEIDSLIEAKQSMADKLREYRKSLISEAVTGKFKVPGI